MSLTQTSTFASLGYQIGGEWGAAAGALAGLALDSINASKNKLNQYDNYRIRWQQQHDFITKTENNLKSLVDTYSSSINSKYGNGTYEAIRALYKKQNPLDPKDGRIDYRLGYNTDKSAYEQGDKIEYGYGKRRAKNKYGSDYEDHDYSYNEFSSDYLKLDRNQFSSEAVENIYNIFANSNELKDVLGMYSEQFDYIMENAFGVSKSRIDSGARELSSYNSQLEMQNLQSRQNIASASAQRASSGIRGTGTGSMNVKLQQLQADLQEASSVVQIENSVRSMLAELSQSQKSSMQSAYEKKVQNEQQYKQLLSESIASVDTGFENMRQMQDKINDSAGEADIYLDAMKDTADDNWFDSLMNY